MHDGRSNRSTWCAAESVDNPQRRNRWPAWTRILEINYWPIFAIARRHPCDSFRRVTSAAILSGLRLTAETVDAAGVDNSHDLTGRIFQRLIADRKYLATFYTLPASAALLARLAVAKLRGVDWSDPRSHRQAARRRLRLRHRRAALGGLPADSRPPRADRWQPR